jgi:peroxiredoxin
MRTISLLTAALVAATSLAVAGDLSGRRAPGFSLPDSKVRRHDLQDYRGKFLLIDIMQTTCPHCRTFSAILEQVKTKYAGRLAILSVVISPPDTDGTVQSFAAQNKITTPILFDCGQMSASYLKVTPDRPQILFPHLFIIDPQGMIVDDYGYSEQTKAIFGGQGIFPILDRLLGAAPARK